MKIISWNVNGLRSVYRTNFLVWLKEINADIVCLQETKAQKQQLPFDLINPHNFSSFFNSAQKKGYSGVAIYVKRAPLVIKKQLGTDRFDNEGRILQLEYPSFTLINLYMPHGGRQKEHLDYKLKVYSNLFAKLEEIKDKKVVLIGDFNVAHKEIDLARPEKNHNSIMFTPEERKQIDELINLGFVDSFRKFHPNEKSFTWWPYFANARQRNLGWRIDYAFVSKKLASCLKNSFIYSQVKGSDHCPIGMEI